MKSGAVVTFVLMMIALDVADPEKLIASSDTIKHKIGSLAGYLEHKFQSSLSAAEFADEYNGEFDSAFLENLHLSGLTMPKLSTVHFVHLAYQMFEKWNIYCCRTHVSQITNINNPIARVQPPCITIFIFERACAREKRHRKAA